MSVELKASENIPEMESNQGLLTANTEKGLDNSVIISELHNNGFDKVLTSNEVQSPLLCSNNYVNGCTSLGVKTQDEIETEIAKKLSAILFNKYVVWKQKQKTLSNMEELAPQNN